ncbi:MAG TPA: AAC(3) family N-acetyltransferase [Candidatus Kryptonia bacterium]|nr:AAC(3) family N-acetyltransferase [Candidatus Kryptonia bacterium]
MNRDDIKQVFEQLAVRGNQLVVHASLSAFGEVEGGATAICQALLDALGAGTVLMPAFTYAETLIGLRPGRTVAFHPDLPVSKEVGAIAEAFRRLPGVLRSSHPTHSFAAFGRHARDLLSTQRDNNLLGPLKKLNIAQGYVLLLGTNLHAATAIHLAEERLQMPYLQRRSAIRLNAAGYEERVVLENVPGCGVAFDRLEQRIDPSKVVSVSLAHGVARRLPVRYLINLAAQALEADPAIFVCDRPDCVSCAVKRDALVGIRQAGTRH